MNNVLKAFPLAIDDELPPNGRSVVMRIGDIPISCAMIGLDNIDRRELARLVIAACNEYAGRLSGGGK